MTELQEPPAAPTAPTASARRVIFGWVGLVVLVVSAVVASNTFSARDRLFGSAIPAATAPVASRDAFAPVGGAAAAPTKLRSQPWWQDATTLTGTGAARSAPFTIGASAIQWRATASCPSGRVVVRTPKQTEPLIDAACPQGAVAEASGTGPMRLDVKADGPWRVQIAQQIDAPLVEPPLAAMTASGARKTATGSFYNVDKTGKGTVAIYRQADGRYSLRLDHFFVSPTTDLEVRLSPRATPHSTKEFTSARSALVSTMDVTAGSLNYKLPTGVDPSRFGSVVIWCAATASAYAAAGLTTTR